MKRLTLCADDFAQSLPISAAILELLGQQRISATSVMSQSPLWPELAKELGAVTAPADIGLHFNLTHSFGLPQGGADSAHSLAYWLMKSQTRQLSRSALCDQWLSQIDRFSQHLNRLPDFIDGHQHVHALPVIREALFDAISLRWAAGLGPYLRAPDRLGQPADSRLKALLLRAVSRGFAEQARDRGLLTAPWFGGLYSFGTHAGFASLMQRWLAQSPHHGLLMCHPGHPAADRHDPIGPARAEEYRYLSSPAFVEDCQHHAVLIGRFTADSQHRQGRAGCGSPRPGEPRR